jgi:predicted transcriptional regulator
MAAIDAMSSRVVIVRPDDDVGVAMTRKLYVVEPDDDLLAVAHLMQEKRIRHVPVVQGENLLGILGIREVLRILLERVWSDQDPAARETARELLSRGL